MFIQLSPGWPWRRVDTMSLLVGDVSGRILDRVTIAEAADRLGVTRDAVRKRIKRGSIEWEREPGGETYVFVDAPATDEDVSAAVGDTSGHALFDRMAGEIDYLRQQLEVWQEEARRKDHI